MISPLMTLFEAGVWHWAWVQRPPALQISKAMGVIDYGDVS